MNVELTKKQQYQRDYYARNKERICATKRNNYEAKKDRKTKTESNISSKKKTQPKPLGSIAPALPCKATSPIILVDKMPVKTRHKIEDIQLAQQLGISVEELN